MRASSVLGGNFIKKEDLKEGGPERLEIAEVGLAEFENEKTGKAEKKLELTFTDERKLTLNNGNTQVLIAAYGDDTDLWTGRPIVAFFDPNVMFGKRKTGGVKVKVPSGVPAKGAATEPATDPFA